MYDEKELKWAMAKTGRVAQIGPNIYRNPIRMRQGGWKFVEAPPTMKKAEPVMVNMPGSVEKSLKENSTQITTDNFSRSELAYSEVVEADNLLNPQPPYEVPTDTDPVQSPPAEPTPEPIAKTKPVNKKR